MTPAVYDSVSADIAVGDYLFRATGSTLKFPGFMQIYVEGSDENEEKEGALPNLNEKENLVCKNSS